MIFSIIKANIDDAKELTKITKAAKAHWNYSQRQLEEWDTVLTISEKYIEENEVYKIIIKNELIGYYSYFEIDTETIKLDNIFITPKSIKKGIGKILMNDFIKKVIKKQYKSIILESEPNAEQFYAKIGFEVIGKEPTSITGRFLPIMKLELKKYMSTTYKIIVAAGQNNEIGDGENLLWHLPKDMRWFKEKTTGADVIMGRKTYESFPEKYRPLPNRTNIVITRNKEYKVPKEVLLCHSIEEAKTIAENCDRTEKYIIGGGTIYEQALDFCDEILLTKVHAEFSAANTFFPTIDMNIWEEVWREDHCADEKHAFDFSFIQYKKK